MAAYMGRDVNKLKSNGKGKWKYMSEKEMLEIAAKFSPYRYVNAHCDSNAMAEVIAIGAFSCGTCGV